MTDQTLADYLEEARARLDRVTPEDLEREMRAGAYVVDVRDSALRELQGPIPGAAVIDLTILEWRLAPSSETRIADFEPGQRVIVVCNQGYSSSLAAARLQDVGVPTATDLEGGFTAWTTWQKSLSDPA